MPGGCAAPQVGPPQRAAPGAAGLTDPAIGNSPPATGTAHASRDRATFRDHCAIDPRWLDEVSASWDGSLPFVWQQKLGAAFKLVTSNALNIDRNAERSASLFGKDQALFKKSVYQNQDSLERFRERAESAYSMLLDRLRYAGPEDRRRALHTFAGAASLRVVQLLQWFEGGLYSESGRLVVRLFPDLPNLQKQRGPLIGLPYRHAVNELAYGEFWGRGFVSCRISRGRESDWKYVHLPIAEAESFQEKRPGPDHLYHGWVLPQWLLFIDGEPPDKDKWWITVLQDEDGVERWSAARVSPWSGPDARRAELPREYRRASR